MTASRRLVAPTPFGSSALSLLSVVATALCAVFRPHFSISVVATALYAVLRPRFSVSVVATALYAVLCLNTASAATVSWKANTTGDWFTATNWEGDALPAAGDDAVITNTGASATLSAATPALNSLTLRSTLIFTNWDSALNAVTVTLLTNGTVTLPAAFSNAAPSNNIYIVCSNLTVNAGGSINADAKGYAGGYSNQNGVGPGAGRFVSPHASGAGYGGIGGRAAYCGYGGLPYGDVSAPLAPGSGGGGSSYGTGGAGGGAIRIQASGTVSVNGAIGANGGNAVGTHGGGGSGGGIYIVCAALAGNGQMAASGGNTTSSGGPGAGGRIAVVYNTAAQTALGQPTVQMRVRPGSGFYYASDLGTLYFPDAALLPETFTTLQGQIWGVTAWSPGRLTVSNVWARFPEAGFKLSVTQDVVIVGTNAKLELGGTAFNTFYVPVLCGTTSGPTLNIDGNLILTNGGSLGVYSAITNAATADHGARVNVWGDLIVASNSWVYPYSHNTNGGSPFFYVKNLLVYSNAGFNADGKGFSGGASNQNGYGGGGGAKGTVVGGGGGGFPSASVGEGRGGGLVRVEAQESIVLNGALSANGLYAIAGGGAAGGGIHLRCNSFTGAASAVLRAVGANGNPANGGGGGRIAVRRFDDGAFQCGTSVTGGSGYAVGLAGSVVWSRLTVADLQPTVKIPGADGGGVGDDFWIGREEIKNIAYAAFLNAAESNNDLTVTNGAVSHTATGRTLCLTLTAETNAAIGYDAQLSVGSRFSAVSGRYTHPVAFVSWFGAALFCNWCSAQAGLTPVYDPGNGWTANLNNNGYRLPTEAEWRKAAAWNNAGQAFNAYGTGTNTPAASDANYYDSGDAYESQSVRATPVGYYAASGPYGLKDASGNVWEWCHGFYDSAGSDPDVDAHAVRGGAWGNFVEDLRTDARCGFKPADTVSTVGFRMVTPTAP